MWMDGGPSCPSSKMVRFFLFFHYIIQISTILQQVTPRYCQQIWQSRQKSTVCSGHPTPYQQSPGTPENKCEHLFSGVVGVLWPPSHLNPQHRAFVLVLGPCSSLWLPPPINSCLSTTAYQQSHKPRDWASVLAFGGCRLSLGQGHCHHCQEPPTPEIKHLRLFSVVVGYPPPPQQQPSDPITPEIERECSLSVVVVFLWLPSSTFLKIEHLHSISGVWGCFWPLQLPQLNHHYPKSSAKCSSLGVVGLQPAEQQNWARFCCSLYSWCIL